MAKIRRAIISVSDKTGVEKIASALQDLQCDIISTGGTRKALENNGIRVIEISNVTGNPEAFGGRMKTISFEIESALLFDRDKDSDEAKKLGIIPIDMVICNLYPFAKVKQEGADLDILIENIDIGGPTMIRAAAKNYKHVAVVTDPTDYDQIIQELMESKGELGLETKKKLMRKAFNYTADYDSMIADTMDERSGVMSKRFAFTNGVKLRYGENSHQTATFLRERNAKMSIYDMDVLHGKELSFNNIGDINAALEAVKDLENEGCAIIKHANPCGLCSSIDQRKSFELAWAGDPVSAFGSVIAFNNTLKIETAEFLHLTDEDKSKRKFVEVIIAPDFHDDTLEYLFNHKNLRVIKFDPSRVQPEFDIKYYFKALLYQDADQGIYDKLEWATETKKNLDKDLIKFGIIASRQLKSNSIAAVRKLDDSSLQLLGMGCGQPNRVNSTELTLQRCIDNLTIELRNEKIDPTTEEIHKKMDDVVIFSDAFFPFPDNVELCHKNGIKVIVQPGGSIRDKYVIKRCNELNVSMLFTGMRHFKH